MIQLVEQGIARTVGTTYEEIVLVEAAGHPALRRTQVLQSDELGNRTAETIVFRDTFLPHSHVDVTAAYRISISYQGSAVIGEKQLAGGEIMPIAAQFESPVFDSHSVEMVLRLLPFADGYVAELPTFHAPRATQVLVTLRVLGRHTVTDSKTSLDAWKLRTDWDGATQYYWIGVETGELIKQSSSLPEGVQLEFVRA